jgi:hypothetical protein
MNKKKEQKIKKNDLFFVLAAILNLNDNDMIDNSDKKQKT